MTRRQVFQSIARSSSGGRVFLPACWFRYWDDTLARWHSEGLPPDIHPAEHFGLDRAEELALHTKRLTLYLPPFDLEVLEDDGRTQVIVDRDGATKRVLKSHRGMDQWLRYPVSDRASWDALKKRLDPDSPARLPAWWAEEKMRLSSVDYPIGFEIGGVFGFVRNWLGMERLSYLLVDDPGLVAEMTEYVEHFMRRLLERVLDGLIVDFVYFGEDIAYKTGLLVSPAFVAEYVAPAWRRLTEIMHARGVPLVMVDSDGCTWELIPQLLRCGIQGIMPCEVAAGMDVQALRKRYGRDLVLAGGIDKRLLAARQDAVATEVRRVARPLLREGGYFPGVDHSVPPDVPLGNFTAMVETLRSLEGC